LKNQMVFPAVKSGSVSLSRYQRLPSWKFRVMAVAGQIGQSSVDPSPELVG